MGYDLNRFVSQPPDALICNICKYVAENPVVGCSEDHLFCQECINQWLKVSPTCPVDRQELTTSNVKPVQRPIMSILLSLQIKCVNHDIGCQFVSAVAEEADHFAKCDVQGPEEADDDSYEEQLGKLQQILQAKSVRRSQPSTGQALQEPPDEDVSFTPTDDMNILVLAETGVGKSTFINAFANYVTYPTLEQAINAPNLMGKVPASFSVTADGEGDSDVYVQKKIIINQDDNEVTVDGESATQATTTYVFHVGHLIVRLIDTPGIGDTRGDD